MNYSWLIITYFLLITPLSYTQSLDSLLRQHILFLAHDSLYGRQSGSENELKAARYIADYLEKIGLSPKGTHGFLQPFPFIPTKEAGPNNYLIINNTLHAPHEAFYPLSLSANDSVSAPIQYVKYGIQSRKPKRDDYLSSHFQKGNIVAIDVGLPPMKKKKHAALCHELYSLSSRIALAEKNGAAAVIFIKNNPHDADPDDWLDSRITPARIPVIYLRPLVWENIKKEKSLFASMRTEILTPEKMAHNVVAYIDNQASHTIVIGAHYDHLGRNEYRNSMLKGSTDIHNGADDNASGVAVMLELARLLKNAPLTASNYLFIAFSAEELGLLGSNYFVNHPTIDLSTVNYMLNYDMVGRLKAEKLLTVNGVASSPQFSVLKNIHLDSLTLQTTESGIGPSDHTSFYLKNIPVLHFFTGLHPDYHKPSDDVDLLNIQGMKLIIMLSMALIDSLNIHSPITFTKTKDNLHNINSDNPTRFRVTLGIMPSYAYEGKGVKIDGVIEGRPAHKAGLEKDDIIIRLGKFSINTLTDYMKALSQYNKGDKTEIHILRQDKLLQKKLRF